MTETDSGRLAVLMAGARERLADAHLVHALDFIHRTSGDIEAPRALDVYCRLHRLDEADARTLKNRVLASFGGIEEDAASSSHTFVAVGGDVEWDITASLFYRLRRRLGGRRNHRLRRWVELHTGFVEGRLLRVHVANVERLLEVTGTGDGAILDVIWTYARGLKVREPLVEAIHIAVCERLYPDVSPAARSGGLKIHNGGA